MSLSDIFKIKQIKQENENLQKEKQSLSDEIKNLNNNIFELNRKISDLGFTEYEQTKVEIDKNNKEISESNIIISKLKNEISYLQEESDKKNKQLKTYTNKLNRSKEIYKSIEYSIDNFVNLDETSHNIKLTNSESNDMDELSPSVILKLNYMNVADLRKAYNANNKQIESVLTQYSARYTTKANKSIYALMVIALKAELQNILTDLKYEKLDKAIEILKNTTSKYLSIAGEGNQNIAGTLTKFIGQIEYLFINAIKIEYNYYVKKEQARQEQLAIREQMRQEAEERKALELEKKKIEKEEEKYNNEISKITVLINETSNNEEAEILKKRLLELQQQLTNVIVKKDEIINLQNGKAGTVYIISNLGSFGENVFKVGMTRRLDPQDRVNELGDASVPFKFDVHSFIFSEDAVNMETKLHEILNAKRLNKVNRRKEFFNVSIDELQKIVYEFDPTAEFNMTMIAEEYRQSLSSDNIYSDDYIIEETEE